MNRRERILQGMGASGGTQAPKNARRNRIKTGLKESSAGARTLPAGMPPIRYPSTPQGLSGLVEHQGIKAPKRTPGRGLSSNYQPGVGKQLSARIQSGAIDQGQAQKVANQRQLLEKAFGPSWRQQIFGSGGAKGASGPFAQRQVAARRAQGLERAKKKLY